MLAVLNQVNIDIDASDRLTNPIYGNLPDETKMEIAKKWGDELENENNEKRHTRGIWLQTINSSGSYPTQRINQSASEAQKNVSIEKQKEELIEFLDMADELNVNTVFFQVRPTADALYESEMLPWSIYLFDNDAMQGVDPGWDPLEFMIEEAHKRNIDLHAWCNPYRVGYKGNISRYASNNVRNTNPEWITFSQSVEVVDPGIPDARIWVEETIMELVRNYDIDGIHFDDYFYNESNYGDYDTYEDNGFQKASGGKTSFEVYNTLEYINGRDDLPSGETAFNHTSVFPNTDDGKQAWRENNINLLIKELSLLINDEKPWVQFGIGPAGVWANNTEVGGVPAEANGSDTRTTYTTKYGHAADTLLWAKEGWIDYIAPQIYWSFDLDIANHGVLMDWWSSELANTDCLVYTGSTLSKVGDDAQSDPLWHGEEGVVEIQRQLRYASNKDGVSGNVLYSKIKLLENESLMNTVASEWKYPAIPEIATSKNEGELRSPKNPIAYFEEMNGKTYIKVIPEFITTGYYILYEFDSEKDINIEDASKIVDKFLVERDKNDVPKSQNIEVQNYKSGKTYVITAMDRIHNESEYTIIK